MTLFNYDDADCEFYKTNGYARISGVPSDVVKLADEIIDDWVSAKISEWLEEGKLTDNFEKLPRDQRFITAWHAAGKPAYNRNAEHYLIHDKMYEFLTHPYMVGLAKNLLGSNELSASGVQNIRLKHPDLAWSVVPWHADCYYWEEHHNDNPLKFIIFWLPLQQVDGNSGCLQVVPTTQACGLDFKVEKGQVAIPEKDCVNFKPETIAMQRGEILAMNDIAIHRSVKNNLPRVHWNIDVRYEITDQSGTITDKYGFVAASDTNPGSVTPCKEWLKKRAPKKVVSYGNK